MCIMTYSGKYTEDLEMIFYEFAGQRTFTQQKQPKCTYIKANTLFNNYYNWSLFHFS